MVLTSISTISSSSSFLSNSYPSTSNSNSTLFRNRPFPSFLVRFPKQPFSNTTFKIKSSSSFSASSTQQEKWSLEQFLQFKEGIDDATDLLQTSIVSYKKKFPWSLFKPFLQVDLVSTIHMADKEYFLALQKKLESYDCVLYEMIASKKTLEIMKEEPDSSDFSILGCIFKLMAQILRLGYQSDYLSYRSENWQHADLDEETYQSLMEERGENEFFPADNTTLESNEAIPEDLDPWRSKLLWASRVLPMPLVGLLIIRGVCTDVGSLTSDYTEIEELLRLDFSAAMKILAAKLLTSDLAQEMTELDEKSVTIGERNQVAIERLRSAMDKGHNKIAILYGGSHMPDLGRRLREEFDLIPSSVEWLTAWSIEKKKGNTSSLPLLTTMALLIISPVLVLDLWFWKLFIGTAVHWVPILALKFFGMFGNYRMI